MKDGTLSEWIYAGIPKIENKSQTFVITVLVSISDHGKAEGNLENLSITVNIYLLFVTDDNGPLKSMFNRSNGCVAFMIWASSGLWKRGLHSSQTEHKYVILQMSSTENGKFLFATNAVIRVIPGWNKDLWSSYNDDVLIKEQYILVNVSAGILSLPIL